jgi:hypothetical protein
VESTWHGFSWLFIVFPFVKVMLEMFKCWCNVLLLSFCPCTPGGFDPILWLHGNLHAIAREDNHCHLAINHGDPQWSPLFQEVMI